MTLWLIRHARPLIGPGRCYGVTDMPADAEHTWQCAGVLAERLPAGLPIWVSPLQRCQQLAHALLDRRPDLRYTTEPDLREMDFGIWENQRWDDIPVEALDAWTGDFAHHRFGERESVQTLLDRVAALRSRMGQGPMAWITHAGVIRAVQVLAQGLTTLEAADQWPREAPDYGAWQEMPLRPWA